MKIVSIEAIPIRISPDSGDRSISPARPSGGPDPFADLYRKRIVEHHTCLVRIETDTGVVGWGEGQEASAPRVIKTIIDDICAPFVLGRSPFDMEAIWAQLY